MARPPTADVHPAASALTQTPAASPRGARETRRQLAVAFDSAPVGMAVTTDGGEIVQANDALAELLGLRVDQLRTRRLEDLAPVGVAADITAGRAQMIDSGQCRHTTASTLRRADGTPVPVSLTCARVPPTTTGPGYLVVHVEDCTERLAAEAELTRRALHDPLTGLPNRALLLDRLGRALTRLDREASTVAVLFADLDDFKHVNDSYGHSVGDQVLAAVAGRLQLLQRPGDTACRYGGDEFVVLCEDSGRDQADSVGRRIAAALATPMRWITPPLVEGGPDRVVSLTLTASLGIATTDDPRTTPDQLLADADRAMYRTKRSR